MTINAKLPPYLRLATRSDLTRDAILYIRQKFSVEKFDKTTFAVNCTRDSFDHLIEAQRLYVEATEEAYRTTRGVMSTLPEEKHPSNNQPKLF